MATRHRPGQQTAAQPPRIRRGNWLGKEKPHMSTVPGTGAFHRRRKPQHCTTLAERCNVRLPVRFIKIRRQQPCGIVLAHGINGGHVPTQRVIPPQVCLDRFVIQ